MTVVHYIYIYRERERERERERDRESKFIPVYDQIYSRYGFWE